MDLTTIITPRLGGVLTIVRTGSGEPVLHVAGEPETVAGTNLTTVRIQLDHMAVRDLRAALGGVAEK